MADEPQAHLDDIEDLLHRRADLSTFLVHYTRAQEGGPDAKANLISMLQSRTIQARTVYGIMKELARHDDDLAATQRCVCFTETPLEHAWMMCRPIKSRTHNFGPYGIAFTKAWARRQGTNPVWYIDQTKGHDWLTGPLDDLREIAVADSAFRVARRPDGEGNKVIWTNVPLTETPIARIAPFIEQMMPETLWGTPKEFWWEREWRHVGDLSFSWTLVVAAFAPEEEHDEIRIALYGHEEENKLKRRPQEPPTLLDPRWGLERMIAKLAGVPDHDAGPFPK